MWQRIQTLYLGIATLLIVALFWSDVAKIALPEGGVDYIPYTSKPLYLTMIIILTVFQVLALGGYRWRMKQVRVVVFTTVLCLGFEGLLCWDFFRMRSQMAFSFTALYPLVAAVLDIMAARNILLDEAIVQSAHRLRSARKK